MTTRSLHRIVGLVMLLPLIGWAATGAFFYLKPGYTGAYELLQVKTYPLEANLRIETEPSWIEVRIVKTILGEHLLARTSRGWLHLDPYSRQPWPEPSADDLSVLVTDAFSENPERYGRVATIQGNSITTDTGVRIELDWGRLLLTQSGKDTRLIDLLYRIHYLQWTGINAVDNVLGALGILAVLVLSLLGARLFFAKGMA
jgi:hypothetical protein